MTLKNVFLYSFLLCFVFTGCSGKKSKKDKTPPELSESFVNTSLTEEFLAFGYELTASQLNPAYEIVVSSDSAQVFAASSGKVTSITYNGGGSGQDDYELFIKPNKNSIYLVIYDHVDDLNVSVGDNVLPGALLGSVGDYGGGLGRIELQINNEDSNLAECPDTMANSNFKSSIETAINLHNINYSSGDDRYFDSSCLVSTVSP